MLSVCEKRKQLEHIITVPIVSICIQFDSDYYISVPSIYPPLHSNQLFTLFVFLLASKRHLLLEKEEVEDFG
ncbi:hypothetical protein CAEBREN_10704 [Caenorhabditis brenneri]|uniref:Uncharacterized protein n=1 Tax=Caenorhabditis brenneri TaxID=135651 RepID=G0N7A7_CAEBE|nr:hypothetical protein CAEBREN_10704 [Caenorhabditis brenneri]